MDLGLILTFIAVLVAGLAAGLGIWMERDPNRPPRWAYGLTALIFMATLVTIATSYMDRRRADEEQKQQEAVHALDQKSAKDRFEALKREGELLNVAAQESKKREEKMADDIARMLLKLNDFAKSTDDPELNAFVSEEFKTAARSSEGVVEKVALRVKDEGGDPETVLAARIPAADLQRATRAIAAAPKINLGRVLGGSRGAPGAAPDGGAGAPIRFGAPRPGSSGESTGVRSFGGRRPGGAAASGAAPAGKPAGADTAAPAAAKPAGPGKPAGTGKPAGRPGTR